MKNNEHEVLDSLIYYITKEELQEIAEQEIDRDMTDDEIEELKMKISEEMIWVVQESIQSVADFTDLEQRSIGEEKKDPRYEVYAKNEIAYWYEFSLIVAFEDEEDARYYVRERFVNPAEEYKIEEVKGGIRQTIVHHKNTLNGGDGFHMDIHKEPKTLQNVHDLEF